MNLMQLFAPWKWARKSVKPRQRQMPVPQRPSFRPGLEVLEDRTLLTAYYVTILGDTNVNGGGRQDNQNADSGDLRWCLTQADKGAGNSVYLGVKGNQKPDTMQIDLQAALPQITQNMTIAPETFVTATVDRSNTAPTDFRIFNIAVGKIVTFGPFNVTKGFLKATEGNGGGIYNAGTLTLDGTDVSNNSTGDNGGGIYNFGNLFLKGASINGNQAAKGGGIYNDGNVNPAGDSPSFIAGNGCSGDGAGLYNGGGANMTLSKLQLRNNTAAGNGGGIYNAFRGKLTIANSTIMNNTATNGDGGGVLNAGQATINQNTFNNNTAGAQGGAIRNTGNGTGKSNTINGNKVTGIPGVVSAGGGISTDAGTGISFALVNSIVAQNTAPTNADVDGTFNDLGHNFIGDGTGGNFYNNLNGDQVGTSTNPLDPLLGPLQNNGGVIDTEMPLAGSTVIDTGDNRYALPADARDFVRIVNGIIDLGAVEYQSNTPAPGLNTNMSVSSSVYSAVLNQPITFTASVLPQGSNTTPTGDVTFMAGNTVLGSAILDANGNASLTISTLTLGSHTITAIYGGDDYYNSNAALMTQLVDQAGSTTVVGADIPNAQSGQQVTFTATVSPDQGVTATPTGSVTFLDGTTVLASVPLALVSGQYQASYATAALGDGQHPITAVYSGDNTFATTSGSMVEYVGQITKGGSGVTLNLSANPALENQYVTLTATVQGDGTPTGSVTFLDGTTVLGSAPLDASGTATLGPLTFALGMQDLTAVYSGDGSHYGNVASLELPIVQENSGMSLNSSANPSPQGQDVTFTVIITPNSESGAVPTGSVTFYDGTTALATVALTLVNGQYQASFTTAALGLGAHQITAIYSGDSTFADNGATMQQTID